MNDSDLILYLKKTFLESQAKNSSFSLRSFARKIDINPGLLSHLFNGKRKITFKTAEHILLRLEISEEEKKRFLSSVESAKRFSI